MKIEYLGHSCFKITANNGISVLTDPYTRVGYELPKNTRADIVTVSHSHFDHNYTQAVKGNPKIITTEDRQALCGVEVEGVRSWHDERGGALRGANIIFKLDIDGLRICHLGDLGEEYSPSLIKEIGKVDILLIPVGGTYTIDAVEAKRYVDEIAPKMVIPMHYRPKGGTIDITDEKPFLSLFDEVEYLGANELYITDLTEEKTKIVFMERKK